MKNVFVQFFKFKIQFVIMKMNLVYIALINRIIRLPFNNNYSINMILL